MNAGTNLDAGGAHAGRTAASNLRVDGARLWDSLEQMARIGPGIAGGNNRQTVTDADGEARRMFQRWCEDAGMTMQVDRMGNMFMRLEGADPSADPVWMGSHLDTQPTGGRYDGVLGVLAALEVVRTIQDRGITPRRPIIVVNWTNEEGTRFAPAMLGSGVFAGLHDEAYANARTDAAGLRFGDELERIGWRGDQPVGGRPIHALLEYHIEQGPILEAEGRQIGVVTHGQGLWWLHLTLAGRDAHTGSTPMAMRADAGLGMARIIEAVNRIALDHQPGAVGSVGHAVLAPNSPNVIAGTARMTIDLRSPDAGKLASMRERVEREAAGIAKAMGLALSVEVTGHFEPVAFDPALTALVRDTAGRLGLSHMDIISGAGHDACSINRIAPAAMIMCPCVGGLSHNEAEKITPDWAAAGCDVLLNAALELAGVAAAERELG